MPIYTLSAPVQAEIEVRKSRFIAYARPVASKDNAMSMIASLRNEHKTATHVCWAFLAGGHSGLSDDGEPSGTAGRPILEVLRRQELEGVAAAVVRYYGGIRLGAGGLMRAYTDAIATAVSRGERMEHVAYGRLRIDCGFAHEARLRSWAEKRELKVLRVGHDTGAILTIRVRTDCAKTCMAELCNLTQGKASVTVEDDA